MYTEALQENERLKSRLQDSKQELVKIRSQLEKVAQVPIFQCFKEFEKTCQEMETKFKWKMEMEKKWSHHILPNNAKVMTVRLTGHSLHGYLSCGELATCPGSVMLLTQ